MDGYSFFGGGGKKNYPSGFSLIFWKKNKHCTFFIGSKLVQNSWQDSFFDKKTWYYGIVYSNVESY